jgi:hypothetical protein
MHNIDQTIRQLVEGEADHARICACLNSDTDLFELYNALSLRIARLFLDELMSFEEADAAMNQLNTIWIDDVIKYDFPEPAYSVYLAFDSGEFSSDNQDPIEAYTKPKLRKLMSDA